METVGKRFYRSRSNKMIAGVCAGLANYLNVDVAIVRLIFVAVGLADGIGVLAYILLAVIIPYEPDGYVSPVSSTGGPAKITWLSDRRNLVAVILILIGSVALLNQLVPWTWWHLHLFWPALLVIAGIYLIVKK